MLEKPMQKWPMRNFLLGYLSGHPDGPPTRSERFFWIGGQARPTSPTSGWCSRRSVGIHVATRATPRSHPDGLPPEYGARHAHPSIPLADSNVPLAIFVHRNELADPAQNVTSFKNRRKRWSGTRIIRSVSLVSIHETPSDSLPQSTARLVIEFQRVVVRSPRRLDEGRVHTAGAECWRSRSILLATTLSNQGMPRGVSLKPQTHRSVTPLVFQISQQHPNLRVARIYLCQFARV